MVPIHRVLFRGDVLYPACNCFNLKFHIVWYLPFHLSESSSDSFILGFYSWSILTWPVYLWHHVSTPLFSISSTPEFHSIPIYNLSYWNFTFGLIGLSHARSGEKNQSSIQILSVLPASWLVALVSLILHLFTPRLLCLVFNATLNFFCVSCPCPAPASTTMPAHTSRCWRGVAGWRSQWRLAGGHFWPWPGQCSICLPTLCPSDYISHHYLDHCDLLRCQPGFGERALTGSFLWV